ncbi:MAG TPA: hypothetical protein VK447_19665 [Myxococcaceae bacterium]|nr:hypothetical protein [Myxococcaceae bacterium]
MSFSINNNFLSSIASSALKSLAPALSSQIQGLLKQVAGPVDSFSAAANLNAPSGSGATRLSAPSPDLATRSGAGATGPGYTNTFAAAPNLNARSGGAGENPVAGIGDPQTNQGLGDAWNQLDAQQKASIQIQKAISRQTEAAALISNIMKAKHDAQMQILGNLK